jgi:hypothetical protein
MAALTERLMISAATYSRRGFFGRIAQSTFMGLIGLTVIKGRESWAFAADCVNADCPGGMALFEPCGPAPSESDYVGTCTVRFDCRNCPPPNILPSTWYYQTIAVKHYRVNSGSTFCYVYWPLTEAYECGEPYCGYCDV